MHKYSTTEEIIHYGVKGMKWGVRKDRTKGSRRRASSDTKQSLLNSTDAKTLYKNRARLTDAEMRDRINRIQMEQNLYKLSKTQPSVSNSGRKMASSIAGRFGNAVLNAVVQESVNYAMPTIKKTIRR